MSKVENSLSTIYDVSISTEEGDKVVTIAADKSENIKIIDIKQEVIKVSITASTNIIRVDDLTGIHETITD